LIAAAHAGCFTMALETGDCLLAYRPLATGDFSASLPANTIHARPFSGRRR
jgi:hypothetical protein